MLSYQKHGKTKSDKITLRTLKRERSCGCSSARVLSSLRNALPAVPSTAQIWESGGLEQRKESAVHQEWYLQPNKPSANDGELKKVSGRQKQKGLPAVPLFSRLKGTHVHNTATGRNKESLREGNSSEGTCTGSLEALG